MQATKRQGQYTVNPNADSINTIYGATVVVRASKLRPKPVLDKFEVDLTQELHWRVSGASVDVLPGKMTGQLIASMS